jgi:hypothetical protein
MPSADSRCAMCSPCGLLTQNSLLPHPLIRVPVSVMRQARRQERYNPCQRRGSLFSRFPYRPAIHSSRASRRNGPPGVFLGYFQRTIVRYTGFNHVTDRGLYSVLRTRPNLPPPKSACPPPFRVRGIPVRQPTLLPPVSFRRTLL